MLEFFSCLYHTLYPTKTFLEATGIKISGILHLTINEFLGATRIWTRSSSIIVWLHNVVECMIAIIMNLQYKLDAAIFVVCLLKSKGLTIC